MVVGIDETIERRWDAKIRARGIHRDPVRSSHGHFEGVGPALDQPHAARARALPCRALVRDAAGAFEPQAFVCTDQAANPVDAPRVFVRLWSIEVTFAELRRHLGLDTQRQWSDLAIARATPLPARVVLARHVP